MCRFEGTEPTLVLWALTAAAQSRPPTTEQLGRDPRDVDEERLRAEYPGAQTLRLPFATS